MPWPSAPSASSGGLIGDALEREQSELHQPMAVRVEGRAVPPEADALAAAFPDATPRLVVFVHGLMGAEFACAPLEQGAHYLSYALNRLPETRAFGSFLRRRSAGIRDLRQGSLVDEDWCGLDPDALKAVACQEVPLLEGATHCFVAATITADEHHPLGRIIGDWLVLAPSAGGRSRARRIPFEVEHGMHVGRTSHLALLNHPRVYERLRDWVATAP